VGLSLQCPRRSNFNRHVKILKLPAHRRLLGPEVTPSLRELWLPLLRIPHVETARRLAARQDVEVCSLEVWRLMRN
jgi:hypothetical protein